MRALHSDLGSKETWCLGGNKLYKVAESLLFQRVDLDFIP